MDKKKEKKEATRELEELESKIQVLNKKLDEWRADAILEDGLILVPVFAEKFTDGTKFKLGHFKYFTAGPTDIAWAKETRKGRIELPTTKV